MSLGSYLDRWRSARQLRNTRLARKASQETARNTRQGGSADAYGQGHQAGYNLGWQHGYRAGYDAAWNDREAGRQA
jgi:flagellar biosynthesis/type III secretory pathway protein FliH